jgi:hypothetical protein
MKKARHDYAAIGTTVTTRTHENIIRIEKVSNERARPNPPSEEMVARLNAIAREYPFCAYVKQQNLFLL